MLAGEEGTLFRTVYFIQQALTGLLFCCVRGLLYDDIHQLSGDVDLLYDLLASNESLDFFVGERAIENKLLGRVGWHGDAAAQFAIDLHGDYELFFFGKRGVVLWPGSFEKISFFAEYLPEFVSEIGSEGREEENHRPLRFSQILRRDISLGDILTHSRQQIVKLHES